MGELKIPEHVAIIMDGNRRWAKKNFFNIKSGHKAGAENLEKILNDAEELGIKYLTVYAFSTENWKRNKNEVNDLMDLMDYYLEKYIKKLDKKNYRIKFIGDIFGLKESLRKKIFELERLSEKNMGLNFIIALNYGGHDEILRAIKKICDKVIRKEIFVDDIDEMIFKKFLDTKEIINPDLLIRTGGEKRLSNFLLWQIAYSELYFCDKLWPDFNKNDLLEAIKEFSKRKRRFGGN